MTYLSWVASYEGRSDAAYFDVLLPRLMDEITLLDGVGLITVPQTPAVRLDVGRGIDSVADELCRNRDCFHVVFIHADTGGRNLEDRSEALGVRYCREIQARCQWPHDRCVTIAPRHETEAWVMADAEAVMDALGSTGDPHRLGLPADAAGAEALVDPKALLNSVAASLDRRGRRHNPSAFYARVAQEQRIEALRGSRSFRDFETGLRRALSSLGCLRRSL